MIGKCLFAALAVGAAATAQAQSWERFLNASPVMHSALATPQGLAVDDTGGVFVRSMDSTDYGGTQFSHLYALDAQGNHAYPWGLIGRWGWTDSRFVPRGFHAFRGERVVWSETGPDTQLYDVIWTFPQGNWYGSELRLQRQYGDEVVAVAADGNGGALVLRRRGENAPFGPLPYYTLARHAAGAGVADWEQTIGHCAPGELQLDSEKIDFALDAQDPAASAVYVLGHCERSWGHPNLHFVERYDLAGNRSSNGEFDPGVDKADIVAWHKLGEGAWLIEQSIGANAQERLLRVADGNGAQPPLPWYSAAPLRVDVIGRGVLVSAPAWPGSSDLVVARVGRDSGMPVPQLTDVRFHDGLLSKIGKTAQWSADAYGNRLLVHRLPPPDDIVTVHADDTLTIDVYGTGSVLLGRRQVQAAPSAPPQLRPLSSQVVVAFDAVSAEGLHGIRVLSVDASSP
jgi:hypothetical protein